MVDRVDERRDAEHIRKEDELLALVVAYPAGARQEPDRRHPFVHGRLDLVHGRMKMSDERGHDLLQARIVAPAMRSIRRGVACSLKSRMVSRKQQASTD